MPILLTQHNIRFKTVLSQRCFTIIHLKHRYTLSLSRYERNFTLIKNKKTTRFLSQTPKNFGTICKKCRIRVKKRKVCAKNAVIKLRGSLFGAVLYRKLLVCRLLSKKHKPKESKRESGAALPENLYIFFRYDYKRAIFRAET